MWFLSASCPASTRRLRVVNATQGRAAAEGRASRVALGGGRAAVSQQRRLISGCMCGILTPDNEACRIENPTGQVASVKRTKLYLETSVFGFHFDESEVNRSKRDATRLLFGQTRKGLFNGFTGAATVLELERTSDERLRRLMFELLHDCGIEVLRLDNDIQRDVALLAEEFLAKGAVPRTKVDDAIHLATMVLRPDLDVLVTWNCRHIANLSVERKVRALALGCGYEFSFRIMTPEEVVVYET